MNDKLRDLMAQASDRIEAANAKREIELKLDDDKRKEEDFTKFKRHVEKGLGQEVLEAIRPVTFNKNFLQQSMTFEQGSLSFRLQQETGALVRLDVSDDNGFSYRQLGHQFNLNNDDSRDIFLHTLSGALKGIR
jgi:hypothetical protein